MEKSGVQPRPMDEVFSLPSAETISAGLEEMKGVSHAVRKRFHPFVGMLAGQETTGKHLLEQLFDGMSSYVASHKVEAKQSYALRELLPTSPDYLYLLMPNDEKLADTLAHFEEKLPEMLKQISSLSLATGNKAQEEQGVSLSDLDTRTIGLLKIPPHRRSEIVKQRLDAYHPGLGGMALRSITGPRRGQLKQPSQRDLSRMQAEEDTRRRNSDPNS